MSKAFGCFDKFVKILLALLIIAMTAIEAAQIVSRFILKTPFAWAEESVRYMFIWATYMAIGIGIDRDAHAKLDLMLKYVPKKFSKAYKVSLLLIAVVFFAMMTVVGIKSAIANYYQLSAAMRLPFTYVIMGVPTGSVIAIIYALKNIVQVCGEKPEEVRAV